MGLAYQYDLWLSSSLPFGLSGAFLLAPVLLYPILHLTRTHQLSSLADLFAFRFRSTWVGAITTIGILLGALPLLAFRSKPWPTRVRISPANRFKSRVALAFCILITLFSILFGARHIATREKHEGLVFAIAFESLVKLIALLAIGAYALFVVFDGPNDLEIWLSQNKDIPQRATNPLARRSVAHLITTLFRLGRVMPHMYHMTFTETLNPRSMVSARLGGATVFVVDELTGCHSMGRTGTRSAHLSGILHPWFRLSSQR